MLEGGEMEMFLFFFQGLSHAISDAEAVIVIWTPNGGHEV